MQKLLIMGAGGLGLELAQTVADLNRANPQFDVLGYVDDDQQLHGQKRLGLPILGPTGWLAEHSAEELAVIPAASDGHVREKFARIARENGFALATVAHPSVMIGADSSISPGVFVAAASVITVNVYLDQCVLVNMGCTIAHDVRMGKFSSVHPGARISGEVTVKDNATIGSQAVVLNRCTVGIGAVIAMGAVVAHDVTDYTLVAGNPARVVRKLPRP